MRLYVEINNEKHYIEKDFAEKYGLSEGKVTPFTGLEIKREDDTTVETVRVNEVETALTAAFDKDLVEISSEVYKDANEAFNPENSSDIAELASQPVTKVNEHPGGVEQSNEILAEADGAEEAINASENTDSLAEEIKTADDKPAGVRYTTSEELKHHSSSTEKV